MAKFKESPSKKSKRYARELKRRRKTSGKALTKATASYRMGYLNARKERSKANMAFKRKTKKKVG